MRIIVKEPGKAPHTMVIPKDCLGVMQQLVDGFIEPVRITDSVIAIVNEESKLKDLAPNIIIAPGEILDVLFGTVIFAGDGGEEFVSLSDEDVKWIMDTLNKGDFVL